MEKFKMKYLFILGMSGSGKTRLAEHIEEYAPKKFKKAVQNTTRQARQNEEVGKEYYFLTPEQYEHSSKNGDMIGQVHREFFPYKYGTNYSEMDPDKINIIVLSIEGFIDAFFKLNPKDKMSVIFINNVQPEVTRENRDNNSEEKYNNIVLNCFDHAQYNLPRDRFHRFNFIEISHEKLKEIRDDKKKLLSFLKNKDVY
jgi:guanylate kinase